MEFALVVVALCLQAGEGAGIASHTTAPAAVLVCPGLALIGHFTQAPKGMDGAKALD